MEDMSLELRINLDKTINRVNKFVQWYGLDHVYVSYSGGRDSDILCDIIRRFYPDIKIVFCNTGMELPQTIAQVYKRISEGWNIEIIHPRMMPWDVWERWGYPVISKTISMAISRFRVAKDKYRKTGDKEKLRVAIKRLGFSRDENGKKLKVGTIPKIWRKLAFYGSTPVSNMCCQILKKEPLTKYGEKNKRFPIMATMMDESNQRQLSLKGPCNIFHEVKGRSNPMKFWTKENILEYQRVFKVEVSKAYTELGMERTGCWGCLYGCYKGADETRMLELEINHPQHHKFLAERMNYKKVCEEIGIKFSVKK